MGNTVSTIKTTAPTPAFEGLSLGSIFRVKDFQYTFIKQPKGNDPNVIWAVALENGLRYAFSGSNNEIEYVYPKGSVITLTVD